MLWISGALACPGARAVLWTAALLVDYGAPLVLYWVPGMRRLPSSTWEVETAHFDRERVGSAIEQAPLEQLRRSRATSGLRGVAKHRRSVAGFFSVVGKERQVA